MVESKDGKSRLPKALSHLYTKLKNKEIDWMDFFGVSETFRRKENNMYNTTTKEYSYDDRVCFKDFIDYCFDFYSGITERSISMGFSILEMLMIFNHKLVGRIFADRTEIEYVIDREYGGTMWDRYTYFTKEYVKKNEIPLDSSAISFHINDSPDDFYITLDTYVSSYLNKEGIYDEQLFIGNVSDLI